MVSRRVGTIPPVDLFYRDLASLWPLVSPVEDYAPEAAQLLPALRARAPGAATLLELGSGGGHLAHHLKSSFRCVLTDLSEPMLQGSRRLNPECEHAVGDMRTLDLGRTFDVVLAHDAIDYMTSEDDLRAVFAVAWRHLNPGGVACFIPDDLAETYEGGTDVSGVAAPDGRGVRLFEWSEPAVPGRTTVVTHYTFLVRDAAGDVRTLYERHVTGLFGRATWVQRLAEAGFEVEVEEEVTDDDRAPRQLFFGKKRRG